MELRQLEYFVTVAELASFTKAADALHVSQPGVSAQVRKLERELGEDLLDRSTRTVQLTSVGVTVLPYAQAALRAVASIHATIAELNGLVRGRVTMGTVTAMGRTIDLPALLASFHEAYPGVEIGLTEDGSEHLVEALRSGRIDLAVIGRTGPRPPGIALYDIVNEPLVAAVGRKDPLFGRKRIGIDELSDRALICLPPGTGLRSTVEAACAAAGFRPHIALEAADPHVLAQLAGRGLGVAIIPTSPARALGMEVHLIDIRQRPCGRLALAWRTDGPTSPAAAALIAHARALLPEAL
ncbi:LysR family transcriptional regulator [Streptomyces sp. ISL-10]|uniref:LysR family transcriptional regulator n=1 Tax=Streptomyces sp. ISL-10 TaxID=2819172 RepID=UPI001BEA57FE|nr:LysR family transcriptional regulator [Streptomyces sp. ISL-10]MBT2367963.1 LysR family transcriptional regulator [Streptomyces sp. ISL-10]